MLTTSGLCPALVVDGRGSGFESAAASGCWSESAALLEIGIDSEAKENKQFVIRNQKSVGHA